MASNVRCLKFITLQSLDGPVGIVDSRSEAMVCERFHGWPNEDFRQSSWYLLLHDPDLGVETVLNCLVRVLGAL